MRPGPTFFPRPALTPGSGEGLTAAQLDALPNWVHKAGSGNDQVQVGTWTEGKPGAQGTGTPGTSSTRILGSFSRALRNSNDAFCVF